LLVQNGNPIASLEGLDGLSGLQSLSANDSEIAGFDNLAAASLGKLKSLSLANAKVEAIEEVDKLAALPSLRQLTLDGAIYILLATLCAARSPACGVDELPTGCDVASGDDYRLEVLVRLPRLEVLDGKAVARVERREANAEADRRAEEAAAAAAAAAAEAEEEEDE